MHELQEEYLVVVRYDVKSYGDLFRLNRTYHFQIQSMDIRKRIFITLMKMG